MTESENIRKELIKRAYLYFPGGSASEGFMVKKSRSALSDRVRKYFIRNSRIQLYVRGQLIAGAACNLSYCFLRLRRAES